MAKGRGKGKGKGATKPHKIKEPKIKKKKYISPQQKWAKAQKQMEKRKVDVHKLEQKCLRKITTIAKKCRDFEIKKMIRRIKIQEKLNSGELSAEETKKYKPMKAADVEKLKNYLALSKTCTAADIASIAFKDLPHPTEHLHTPAVDHIVNEKARRRAANKAARAAGLDPNNLPLPPAKPGNTTASSLEQAGAPSEPSQTAQPSSMKLEVKSEEASEQSESDAESDSSEDDSDESGSESGESDSDEAEVKAEPQPMAGNANSAAAVKDHGDEDQFLEVFDDSKGSIVGPFAEKVIKHAQVQEVIEVVKRKLAFATEKLEIFKCQCVKWKATAEEADAHPELHQPPVDYRMKPPGKKTNHGTRIDSVRKQEKKAKKIEKKQKKAARLSVKVQNRREKRARAEASAGGGGASSAASLHPSWAAKKQQPISAAPQGKKTVFQE